MAAASGPVASRTAGGGIRPQRERMAPARHSLANDRTSHVAASPVAIGSVAKVTSTNTSTTKRRLQRLRRLSQKGVKLSASSSTAYAGSNATALTPAPSMVSTRAKPSTPLPNSIREINAQIREYSLENQRLRWWRVESKYARPVRCELHGDEQRPTLSHVQPWCEGAIAGGPVPLQPLACTWPRAGV